MFGNTKGWGVSVLIVAVISLLIYFMGQPPQITPPTKSIPLALAPAAPVDPASLGIKPKGSDADAHDLYTKVIEDFKENQRSYEKKYGDVKVLLADKPEFLQWIVDAADCNKATVFGKRPETLISYDNQLDALNSLKQAGLYADNLGLYLVAVASKNKTSFDEADKYLKGAFMLGERLYYERLRFEEFTAGTELMTKAAYAMQKEAVSQHDDGRAATFATFQTDVDDYNSKIQTVWLAISGIDGMPLKYSGDIFDVALNSKEPMWRIEAILKLGRMHYMNSVTAADQRGAVRILKQLADNGDSLPVRTAATKARDLKVEDFRMIGGGT